MSKIVEKKNESKSQRFSLFWFLFWCCVKDRWEKEWKQITTLPFSALNSIKLCQRSLRKRMKANHNRRGTPLDEPHVVSKIVEKKNESKSQLYRSSVDITVGCVKDRWEKEWKQITTAHYLWAVDKRLCQRSLRKRMKANHNCNYLNFRCASVVSKIVEKKNESKSQLWFSCSKILASCVKDRWEKEWKQITTYNYHQITCR